MSILQWHLGKQLTTYVSHIPGLFVSSKKRYMPAQWQDEHSHVLSSGVLLSLYRNNLRSGLEMKQCHFLQNQTIILHDNARPHTMQTEIDAFICYVWEVLYHLQYSVCTIFFVSLRDFDPIPKMKNCSVAFLAILFQRFWKLYTPPFKRICAKNASKTLTMGTR